MNTVDKRDFGTYPRRFSTYRWYKPLLVGILIIVFMIVFDAAINSLTKMLFSVNITSTGYDDLDFFTAAGAFKNGARGADVIPAVILAALIVRDRPVSSYFSSMGGWRWKVFLKTFAAGLILFGIPNILRYLLPGRTGDVRFTAGGLILMALLMPLQGIAEELLFRGYVMQTTGSWFKLTAVGAVVQTLLFAAVHPYNMTGVIDIAVSGLIYALICIFSNGIEASSALHILNNVTGILMAGFGYGAITAETTAATLIVNSILKIVFFLFILFAGHRHWFDELKYDDAEQFNSRRAAKHR